jgi:hypothetical protein
MPKKYIEVRSSQSNNYASDIVKHWQGRHELGSALIICSNPAELQPRLSRCWKSLTQEIQAKRDNTTATDQLLRYTHQIGNMQQIEFGYRINNQSSTPTVDCVTISDLQALSETSYFSVYVTNKIDRSEAARIVTALPNESLITCYRPFHQAFNALSLLPKASLETEFLQQWQTIQDFLTSKNILLEKLSQPSPYRTDYINYSLDTLLADSAAATLLQLAARFRSLRRLAQPSSTTAAQNRLYDTLIVLARYIQAWSPGINEYFRASIEDPMFFNDTAKKFAQNLLPIDNFDQPEEFPNWWNQPEPCES